jgi:Fis family transcriptional regulator
MPSKPSLRELIRNELHHYFANLEGEDVSGIYNLVLSEVEVPLLEVVMHYAGNQSRAAEWLGLNRGTLRKLLQKYEIA